MSPENFWKPNPPQVDIPFLYAIETEDQRVDLKWIKKCLQNLRWFSRFGAIWRIFKKSQNTHGVVLLLVNFTKINTPPWMFFVHKEANRVKASLLYHKA